MDIEKTMQFIREQSARTEAALRRMRRREARKRRASPRVDRDMAEIRELLKTLKKMLRKH